MSVDESEALFPCLWFVDRLDLHPADGAGDEVRLAINGWAYGRSVTLRANGIPFDRVEYPWARPDMGFRYWEPRRAGLEGIRGECTAPYTALFRDGVLELSCETDGAAPAIEEQRSLFYRDPAREAPFPDGAQRARVTGNDNLLWFALPGCTDLFRLDAVARRYAGRPLAQIGRVLDWGCGCGRVARYVAPVVGGERFTGVDIDRDNVGWCAAHLPGTYVATTLRPPLPFADASFECIYGISVFTHLRIPLQNRWLEELQRLAAPGALLLMTVHGPTVVRFACATAEEERALVQRIGAEGLHVTASNPQIDGHAEHEGEYVDAFHAADYLRQHWGRYFDIVAVLPAYVFTHDLVVMRRR